MFTHNFEGNQMISYDDVDEEDDDDDDESFASYGKRSGTKWSKEEVHLRAIFLEYLIKIFLYLTILMNLPNKF